MVKFNVDILGEGGNVSTYNCDSNLDTCEDTTTHEKVKIKLITSNKSGTTYESRDGKNIIAKIQKPKDGAVYHSWNRNFIGICREVKPEFLSLAGDIAKIRDIPKDVTSDSIAFVLQTKLEGMGYKATEDLKTWIIAEAKKQEVDVDINSSDSLAKALDKILDPEAFVGWSNGPNTARTTTNAPAHIHRGGDATTEPVNTEPKQAEVQIKEIKYSSDSIPWAKAIIESKGIKANPSVIAIILEAKAVKAGQSPEVFAKNYLALRCKETLENVGYKNVPEDYDKITEWIGKEFKEIFKKDVGTLSIVEATSKLSKLPGLKSDYNWPKNQVADAPKPANAPQEQGEPVKVGQSQQTSKSQEELLTAFVDAVESYNDIIPSSNTVGQMAKSYEVIVTAYDNWEKVSKGSEEYTSNLNTCNKQKEAAFIRLNFFRECFKPKPDYKVAEKLCADYLNVLTSIYSKIPQKDRVILENTTEYITMVQALKGIKPKESTQPTLAQNGSVVKDAGQPVAKKAEKIREDRIPTIISKPLKGIKKELKRFENPLKTQILNAYIQAAKESKIPELYREYKAVKQTKLPKNFTDEDRTEKLKTVNTFKDNANRAMSNFTDNLKKHLKGLNVSDRDRDIFISYFTLLEDCDNIRGNLLAQNSAPKKSVAQVQPPPKKEEPLKKEAKATNPQPKGNTAPAQVQNAGTTGGRPPESKIPPTTVVRDDGYNLNDIKAKISNIKTKEDFNNILEQIEPLKRAFFTYKMLCAMRDKKELVTARVALRKALDQINKKVDDVSIALYLVENNLNMPRVAELIKGQSVNLQKSALRIVIRDVSVGQNDTVIEKHVTDELKTTAQSYSGNLKLVEQFIPKDPMNMTRSDMETAVSKAQEAVKNLTASYNSLSKSEQTTQQGEYDRLIERLQTVEKILQKRQDLSKQAEKIEESLLSVINIYNGESISEITKSAGKKQKEWKESSKDYPEMSEYSTRIDNGIKMAASKLNFFSVCKNNPTSQSVQQAYDQWKEAKTNVADFRSYVASSNDENDRMKEILNSIKNGTPLPKTIGQETQQLILESTTVINKAVTIDRYNIRFKSRAKQLVDTIIKAAINDKKLYVSIELPQDNVIFNMFEDELKEGIKCLKLSKIEKEDIINRITKKINIRPDLVAGQIFITTTNGSYVDPAVQSAFGEHHHYQNYDKAKIIYKNTKPNVKEEKRLNVDEIVKLINEKKIQIYEQMQILKTKNGRKYYVMSIDLEGSKQVTDPQLNEIKSYKKDCEAKDYAISAYFPITISKIAKENNYKVYFMVHDVNNNGNNKYYLQEAQDLLQSVNTQYDSNLFVYSEFGRARPIITSGEGNNNLNYARDKENRLFIMFEQKLPEDEGGRSKDEENIPISPDELRDFLTQSHILRYKY